MTAGKSIMRSWQMAALCALLVAATANCGLTQSYCNITGVDVEELSNGVQISVHSDGRLEWRETQRADQGKKLTFLFSNARLQLDETFYQFDTVPLTYLQFVISASARQGVGCTMTVGLSERAQVRSTTSRNLQTLIVTLMTQRTTAGGREDDKAKTPETGRAERELSVESDNGLLTVRALNADIHEVVARIAKEGDVNVAVDDHVKHKVSINIENAPAMVIMECLAAGYGLALSEVGDVVMFSEGVLKKKDLATYNRSETASFPITYLKADAAAGLLPNFLISYLHVNAEQNAVVVTAPSQMLAKIQSDLKAVDVPPPLIMVDALVVEITKTGEFERDLETEYTSEDLETSMDAGKGRVVYDDEETAEVDLENGVVATARLTARLKALISKGAARIRANPRMAAVNGKRAELFIGAQRFIKVTYSQYGQQQERIEGVPVGVKLDVTPWTGGGGEITTRIWVEVSNISSIDPATGMPRLSTRHARTTVRTKDGETIIIGGLIQRQTETTHRKIPLLGDIPLIGQLFRSKSSTSVETELLIFLTPQLLDNRGRLSPEKEAATRSRFLEETDPGYMPPQEQ